MVVDELRKHLQALALGPVGHRRWVYQRRLHRGVDGKWPAWRRAAAVAWVLVPVALAAFVALRGFPIRSLFWLAVAALNVNGVRWDIALRRGDSEVPTFLPWR